MPATKLLSDSTIFKTTVASINAAAQAQVTSGLAANFGNLLKDLPNEADDGAVLPAEGSGQPYLSGSGVLKIA